MKVELEIVTDGSLPTEADGETVLKYSPTEIWHAVRAKCIKPGDIWMRQPPPPKPPIDTSLAASIERLDNTVYGRCQTGKQHCDCAHCDLSRCIEAARKWEENQKLIASLCDSDANAIAAIYGASNEAHNSQNESDSPKVCSSDPDGVGEGWRRVLSNESVKQGDEYFDSTIQEWTPSVNWLDCHKGRQSPGTRYRRRIEAEQ